jgi:hypothetical protein
MKKSAADTNFNSCGNELGGGFCLRGFCDENSFLTVSDHPGIGLLVCVWFYMIFKPSKQKLAGQSDMVFLKCGDVICG